MYINIRNNGQQDKADHARQQDNRTKLVMQDNRTTGQSWSCKTTTTGQQDKAGHARQLQQD